jgi:hypothetical protein
MARETRDRPRHENAEPDQDPADTGEVIDAIDAASFGEIVEIPAGGSVDGDFNGAPELAGLAETQSWEGSDALDAMQGREPDALLASDEALPEEILEDVVADRRALLLERLDEARELGLEGVFESVAEATEPRAGTGPLVADRDELVGRLQQIDAAIEEIELRIEESDATAPPRPVRSL